jgi:hypothetical protein
MFLGSIQLVCFSIFAEYLGHIYEEIKRRPRYIVRDMIDHRDGLPSEVSEATTGSTSDRNVPPRPPFTKGGSRG